MIRSFAEECSYRCSATAVRGGDQSLLRHDVSGWTIAGLVHHREHSNLIGEALQGTSPFINKTKPRACDKITDSARHKHLIALSLGCNPGCHVNCNSGNVLPLKFDLTRVQTAADL